MKKHISLLIMSLALLCMIGCSDDDTVFSGLTIDSTSAVEFDARGGTGTIAYTADGAVTVTSDKTWLTVSTPGNGTVAFTVDANEEIDSRTAQVTLSANGVSQMVAITQMGLYFDVEELYELSAAGETLSFDFYADTDVSVTVNADWLTAAITDGKLIMSADINDTGRIRTATVTFAAGWKTVSAEVRQSGILDYYEYFQGDWNLVYSGGSVPVTLVPDATGTGYILKGLDFDVAVDYNSVTHRMSITTQYVGRYGSYYAFWCPWDSSEGYYTWSAGAGSDLTFNDNEEEPAILFTDNGVWGSYTVNAFLFRAFTSMTTSSSTSAGSIATYASVSGLYR